jgi:alginate O-acetyltransferase complex protein AlgJ
MNNVLAWIGVTGLAVLSAAPAQEPAAAFLKDCATRAEAAASMTVPGKDGWFFLKGELRHLGAGEFWGEAAQKVSAAARADAKDPLPAILDFKQQLDKLGIELIMLPVPPKALVYPDKLSDSVAVKEGEPPPRLDVHHQKFYALLKEKGVTVIDLFPELAKERLGAEGAMYCRTDTHWSGLACIRVARLLAKDLQSRPWIKDVPKAKFESETKTISATGDLIRDLKPTPAPESLPLRFVGTRTENRLNAPVADPKSPVLLLADSHGLVFHIGEDLLASGAGLADQLALELGFAVDEIGSRGDGITTVRVDLFKKAKADPEWLKSKKVILWCFTAREFTENSNGWRLVPVVKK